MMRRLCAIAAVALTASLRAQQPMGTVPTHDALVTGSLEVQGERARLITNASITAYDHTATISLDRGGEVLVCSTSQFHLLHAGTGKALLFGLDRGSIELHTAAQDLDIILTPDIRFSLEHTGSFDLRLRVTPNGDTCVDNVGTGAPVLMLTDPFSSTSYRLLPGQHVLFEHGSLQEVVDNERSPCGCPVVTPPTVLTADATPAEKAAAAHPFPTAVSQGLAPTAHVATAAPAGEPQPAATQVFVYDPKDGDPNGTDPSGKPQATSAPEPPAALKTVLTAPPPSPPGAHDIFHAIEHFFHKLFHPSGGQGAAANP